MVTRPPLGRGLASLLPASAQSSALQDLSIDKVQPDKDQPRKVFDDLALEELAASIARHGIIQPLIVRKENNSFTLVAGERRWRAARLAGLSRVPVVIREPEGASSFELALVENLQRQDLNPVDEALAYQHLRDSKDTSATEIAQTIGKSRSHVSNMMRLLELPTEALQAMGHGQISPGHGRAILMVPTHQDREAFFAELVQNKWSVRRAEREARSFTGKEKDRSPKMEVLAPYYTQIANELGSSLGLPIHIRAKKNRGVVEIPFESLDALKRIQRQLAGSSKGEETKE